MLPQISRNTHRWFYYDYQNVIAAKWVLGEGIQIAPSTVYPFRPFRFCLSVISSVKNFSFSFFLFVSISLPFCFWFLENRETTVSCVGERSTRLGWRCSLKRRSSLKTWERDAFSLDSELFDRRYRAFQFSHDARKVFLLELVRKTSELRGKNNVRASSTSIQKFDRGKRISTM